MNRPAPPDPAGLTASGSLRHVFVRDLVLRCSIGVHRHEHRSDQRVRINIDLAVDDGGLSLDDDIANVVSYEEVVQGVKRLVARRHVNLVETLAEQIAELCLKDSRVASARVRVEKLDAIAEAASVGVDIERVRSDR
ncbi:MAG: dihydroneopterin aldolase [Alphaproteobacteria bacterium]